MKKIITICSLIIAHAVSASELTFQFVSPSFSGVGYSSHVLTIKQLEDSRRQKLRDEAKAATDKIERDAKNTTLSKFIVNLESRIYAQLSKQLADAMFSETAGDSGTLDFQGSTITWFKTGTDVTLTVLEVNGSRTEITVPVGSFAF
jgi:ribosomal protein S1